MIIKLSLFGTFLFLLVGFIPASACEDIHDIGFCDDTANTLSIVNPISETTELNEIDTESIHPCVAQVANEEILIERLLFDHAHGVRYGSSEALFDETQVRFLQQSSCSKIGIETQRKGCDGVACLFGLERVRFNGSYEDVASFATDLFINLRRWDRFAIVPQNRVTLSFSSQELRQIHNYLSFINDYNIQLRGDDLILYTKNGYYSESQPASQITDVEVVGTGVWDVDNLQIIVQALSDLEERLLAFQDSHLDTDYSAPQLFAILRQNRPLTIVKRTDSSPNFAGVPASNNNIISLYPPMFLRGTFRTSSNQPMQLHVVIDELYFDRPEHVLLHEIFHTLHFDVMTGEGMPGAQVLVQPELCLGESVLFHHLDALQPENTTTLVTSVQPLIAGLYMEAELYAAGLTLGAGTSLSVFEHFADSGINWVYNSFTDDVAGEHQRKYFNELMYRIFQYELTCTAET